MTWRSPHCPTLAGQSQLLVPEHRTPPAGAARSQAPHFTSWLPTAVRKERPGKAGLNTSGKYPGVQRCVSLLHHDLGAHLQRKLHSCPCFRQQTPGSQMCAPCPCLGGEGNCHPWWPGLTMSTLSDSHACTQYQRAGARQMNQQKLKCVTSALCCSAFSLGTKQKPETEILPLCHLGPATLNPFTCFYSSAKYKGQITRQGTGLNPGLPQALTLLKLPLNKEPCH